MGKKKTAVSKKKSTPVKSEKSKTIKKTYVHHTKDQKWEFLDSYNKKFDKTGFSTRAVHYGQPPDPFYGSVNMPIHMTSTYA